LAVFIVAEIGINHNGDIEIAKDLIKVAKESGCNAVKFQKRNIDKVYSEEFLNSYRDSPWGKTQRDQKNGLEFDLKQYQEIDSYCKDQQIEWFVSAWDISSQLFINDNFKCNYNKVASAMNVHKKLMELIASEGKHTFISTGMSSIDEIEVMVEIFEKQNCSFELMHTVSTYPMKDSDANLKMIDTLKNRFNCNVGYSGHETGVAISTAAVALGVTSIERHITLDRSMYGSDQSASLEPNGLRQLVSSIRKIEIAMGDGIKKFSDEERNVALSLRQRLN